MNKTERKAQMESARKGALLLCEFAYAERDDLTLHSESDREIIGNLCNHFTRLDKAEQKRAGNGGRKQHAEPNAKTLAQRKWRAKKATNQ